MKKTIKIDNKAASTKSVFRAWVAPISDVSYGGSWCPCAEWGIASGDKEYAGTYYTTRNAAESWVVDSLDRRFCRRAGKRMKSRRILTAAEVRKNGGPTIDGVDVKAPGAKFWVLDKYGDVVAVGGVTARKVLTA